MNTMIHNYLASYKPLDVMHAMFHTFTHIAVLFICSQECVIIINNITLLYNIFYCRVCV